MNDTTNWIEVAVCGAHMSGLPLNPQLLGLGGQLVGQYQTSPDYRLYKLAGFQPERPGMVRVPENGAPIELEVWRLPIEKFGELVASVPAPLCIGSVQLADGKRVQGYLCEGYAAAGALDISPYGGWRGFISGRDRSDSA